MKQSYKQLFSIFTIMLITGQCAFAHTNVNGHLSPNHRRLSQQGMLNLSIDGEGFFAFALRVKSASTDAANDESMKSVEEDTTGTTAEQAMDNYNGAQEVGETDGTPGPANTASTAGEQADHARATAGTQFACEDLSAAGLCEPGTATDIQDSFAVDDLVVLSACGTATNNGNYKISAVVDDTSVTLVNLDGSAKTFTVETASTCVLDAPKQGVENTVSETGYYIQIVYSRDGSLHVNKYGFLVDDNGLLLMGAARDADGNEDLATTVAKEAIHIPSRALDIIVTNTGKVVCQEDTLGGAANAQAGPKFLAVGQIKLTRFANPMGLNVRLHMKSRCSSMNEIGFSLGNWCAGTPLDGKAHEYLAETKVSGPGEKANPGDAGFGRLVQ